MRKILDHQHVSKSAQSAMMVHLESLLSAPLFLSPQIAQDRIFFQSNLSGQMNIYVMDTHSGSPKPLLPHHVALNNPKLLHSRLFFVFPNLGKVLIMLDRHGDESYQPTLLPIDGGIPEPAFNDSLAQNRVYCTAYDLEQNIVYLCAESLTNQHYVLYQANIATGVLEEICTGQWPLSVSCFTEDHQQVLILEFYTDGDTVLSHWVKGTGYSVIYGTPFGQRTGEPFSHSAMISCQFTPDQRGALVVTSAFCDSYSIGYLDLTCLHVLQPVPVLGTVHVGTGELIGLSHLGDARYTVAYNIDGCSWLYEGTFDSSTMELRLEHVLCGRREMSEGVVESVYYERQHDRFILSFASATSPTELWTVEGIDRSQRIKHTREHILGVPRKWLSPGEDASYSSFDGLRISARLYLPAEALGYEGPRPLVYYIHGGPQSQERPDFAWFSMPLIQFLTLCGFAVFVPNVRGSSGYGLCYSKLVERDWGGNDRLDHVHAMHVLSRDPRIAVEQAGVIGRSYGGYMSLMLATRHPELWRAAVDLFGPTDLTAFIRRTPESQKPYFMLTVGDPDKDGAFLAERSPSTYLEQLHCPLLIIQGQNDSRVLEEESRALADRLRVLGKEYDYLVFDDEGHDVLTHANRVCCCMSIAAFFKRHLA